MRKSERRTCVYRLNTGSCGGCDSEIEAAIATDANLDYASTPLEADLLLLTGPVTHSSKAALQRILREAGEKPLLVVGRCAIDGYPFGKGGVEELEGIAMQQRLNGCPPDPKTIRDAVVNQNL